MSFDAQALYELLPAVYRLRDGEGAAGTKGVLRGLIDVIAGEVAALEEDLEQLYDDQFIETCAEWVAPYIGDLLGYRTLYGMTDKVGSPRAEVANTIAYRRRKGTAAMLEQLARDVTGWDARAVEFFQLLAATQYLNHLRPHSLAWVGVRRAEGAPRIDGPFDVAGHSVEVRRIARRRGRHNIPNVGIHAWRLRDYPLRAVPAEKFVTNDNTDRRYLLSPLRANLPLFSHPEAEESITHIAERGNVPDAITRRELWDHLATFYPRSVEVTVDGTRLPPDAVASSDLSDVTGGWAYPAVDRVLVDPALGRLSLPPSLTVDGTAVSMIHPVVTYSYGFPADIGGGPYPRLATFSNDLGAPAAVPPGTIAAAVTNLAGSGLIEVSGNGRLDETLKITAGDGERIELRAAEGSRPVINLGADFEIDLGDDADVTLNGLVFTGAPLRVPTTAKGGRLRLVHCTLVPGIDQKLDGEPTSPGTPSLVVSSGLVVVEIERSIVGGVRANENAIVRVTDSIVDAGGRSEVAYAAPTGKAAGGELEVIGSTVIGKVHARILRLVSNSILDARLGEADTWDHPVAAQRRQEGCLRFSYVPPGSRTPRRYECEPSSDDDALRVQPQFTSERYGDPAYCQLSLRCPSEIRTGADDESEMGAYHNLFAPQRETNLHVRLEEYLRFGLEAGVMYAT
jgi:hypothetical protein